jgi:hypothetical protein
MRASIAITSVVPLDPHRLEFQVPSDPYCLVGKSLVVESCFYNPLTGAHLLVVDIPDGVECMPRMPRSLWEAFDLGFDEDSGVGDIFDAGWPFHD